MDGGTIEMDNNIFLRKCCHIDWKTFNIVMLALLKGNCSPATSGY